MNNEPEKTFIIEKILLKQGSICCLSLLLFLVGCSGSDDCLTKLEPWSIPNDTKLNLGQCWTQEDLIHYYTTNIGTQLVPYKLVMPLKLAEAPDKTNPNKLVITDEPFFTKDHIENRWRFLALEDSDLNEQSDVNKEDVAAGWPLGFVIDKRDEHMSGKPEWQGEWLGPICAACHTGQVEYQGKTLRIPGGPAMADFDRFLQDLKNSLASIEKDGTNGGARFTQYLDRYTKKFGPKDQATLLAEVKEALDKRIRWHKDNDPYPSLPHGYGRLDAFNVAYNEIIAMTGAKSVDPPRPDAPVSFAFLWDVSHHNQTHSHGAAPAIPMAFNIAGTLAISAKYDPDAGLFKNPSTIRLPVLRRMQKQLDRLRSPEWPQPILGPIVKKKAEEGRKLFQKKCQICHEDQERKKPLKFIEMAMIKIDENTEITREIILPIETDSNKARYLKTQKNECRICHWDPEKDKQRNPPKPPDPTDYAYHDKEPGIARDIALPVQTDSKMAERADHRELIDRDGAKLPAAAALGNATLHIVFSLRHPGEWFAFAGEVLSALFTGGYVLSDKRLDDYKARPLDGIWATAPYLHNGSVPNLYEVLLPQAKRTKQFCVGNREFDPDRVGFVMLSKADCDAKKLFWLDTSQDGNRNIGHEGPGYDVPSDEIGNLIEYLKTM